MHVGADHQICSLECFLFALLLRFAAGQILVLIHAAAQIGSFPFHFLNVTVTFRPFGVFADRIICYGFGFGKDLTGLLIGILQDLFFGLFDLFGLLTQLLLETGYFLSAFRDCFLLLLELDAGSLQITQHIFKVLGVGGDAFSGVLYDILTQTELAGYGKKHYSCRGCRSEDGR